MLLQTFSDINRSCKGLGFALSDADGGDPFPGDGCPDEHFGAEFLPVFQSDIVWDVLRFTGIHIKA
jgi:hypothetical protein